jgi:hypothetical protein
MRRSISVSQASSTPSFDSGSRLSIKRPVSAARSRGLSLIASSNSFRADVAIAQWYSAQHPQLDTLSN